MDPTFGFAMAFGVVIMGFLIPFIVGIPILILRFLFRKLLVLFRFIFSLLKIAFRFIDENGIPNDLLQFFVILFVITSLIGFDMLDQIFAAEPFLNVRLQQFVEITFSVSVISTLLYYIHRMFEFNIKFRRIKA